MNLLVQAGYAQMHVAGHAGGQKYLQIPIGAAKNFKPKDLTLNDALSEAYQKNPDLEGVRAQVSGAETDWIISGIKFPETEPQDVWRGISWG